MAETREPRTALLTGAAGGMGRAIARALVASRRQVVLVDRAPEPLHALQAELGPAAHAVVLDVSDGAAVAALPSALPPAFGRIDILINNAGHDIGGRTRFDLGSADDWAAIVETNLIGLMRVSRAILPDMVTRNRGDIVNMSSISALRLVPNMAAYTASKTGVHAFTGVLRGELAETGIRVTEIMPGLTRTGIIAARYRGDEEAAERYFAEFKMALAPEDVARCILFALDQPPEVQIAEIVVLPVNHW